MKRLTLDQAWEECLKMWKWISRRCEKGKIYTKSDVYVPNLKRIWLDANTSDDEFLSNNCFFCEYDNQFVENDEYVDACDECPGRKVNAIFVCSDESNDWLTKPRLFYAKLKELNKIRLARKGVEQ